MDDGNSERHCPGRTMKQSYQERYSEGKKEKVKLIRLSQFHSRLWNEIDVKEKEMKVNGYWGSVMISSSCLFPSLNTLFLWF